MGMMEIEINQIIVIPIS